MDSRFSHLSVIRMASDEVIRLDVVPRRNPKTTLSFSTNLDKDVALAGDRPPRYGSRVLAPILPHTTRQ